MLDSTFQLRESECDTENEGAKKELDFLSKILKEMV